MALLALATLAACQTAPRPGAVTGSAPQPVPPPAAPLSTPPASPPPSSAAAPAPAPPVRPLPAPRPPRLGLALGGGAARGFAHIGVLQVLDENGIRPDLIVGTSAGSLVAALYAAGISGADIGALAQGLDEGLLTDWSFPGRGGVIRGEALARWVRQHTGGRTIEQLPLPLGIVATDLDNGQPVLFRRGDPGLAVRASSAVPGVFQPVRISGREYVDGGLVAPVPVRFARQMGADLVLAVDISQVPEGAPTGDVMKLLLQTFAIMGRSINQFELREADWVLRPALVGMSGADFSSRTRAILAGREAARQQLPALRARIAAFSRPLAQP